MFRTAKIFTFYFFISISFLYSQNLINNPGFETFTNCPTGLDQLNKCQGWTSFRTSPDYFNSCSSVSGIAPPSAAFGFQQPLGGNAYAGFVTFDNSGFAPNYREILGSKLTTTLTIGTKYYFSFFVSYSGIQAFELATNKTGLRFSTIPYSVSNPIPINNFAHYYSLIKVTDSLNWTKFNGSFIADSLYQYIAFGNFFDDANTDTISTGLYDQLSYYYIDNVCLSTDSDFAFSTSIGNIPSKNNTLSIYPNPCSNFLNFDFSNKIPKKIILFDHNGKAIYEKTFLIYSQNFVVDISNIPNGLYLVSAEFSDAIESKKIIINQ